MAIPSWTVELIKRQINDVAGQLKDPEQVKQLRERASQFLHDLPQTASRVWDQAREGVQPASSSRRESPAASTLLNASGVYCGDPVVGSPLSPDAVQAGIDTLTSFRTNRRASQDWLRKSTQRVTKIIGCERMLMTSRIESAILALAELAKHRQSTIFVPRCCAIALRCGMSLPDVLASAGATVREIGSNHGLSESDWQRAQATGQDLLVVAGDPAELTLPAAKIECLLVGVVADGTIRSLGDAVTLQPPVFSELLKGRCDLVITSGDGLLEGPECGLLLGDRQALEAIEATALWPVVEASQESQAMMLAAVSHATPLASMLETSIENLRHRAENMATRLAAAGGDQGGSLRQCIVTDQPAKLVAGAPYEVASRQLRLWHNTLSAEQWAAQLADRSPAILASIDGDALVIDLRWIDVSQDNTLAQALA